MTSSTLPSLRLSMSSDLRGHPTTQHYRTRITIQGLQPPPLVASNYARNRTRFLCGSAPSADELNDRMPYGARHLEVDSINDQAAKRSPTAPKPGRLVETSSISVDSLSVYHNRAGDAVPTTHSSAAARAVASAAVGLSAIVLSAILPSAVVLVVDSVALATTVDPSVGRKPDESGFRFVLTQKKWQGTLPLRMLRQLGAFSYGPLNRRIIPIPTEFCTVARFVKLQRQALELAYLARRNTPAVRIRPTTAEAMPPKMYNIVCCVSRPMNILLRLLARERDSTTPTIINTTPPISRTAPRTLPILIFAPPCKEYLAATQRQLRPR